MKKIAPIVIVIVVLLIIGKIVVKGKVNDLEKNIIESVKRGNYYTALEDAKEIEFQGEKMSRKIEKLIEDIKLFQAAENEIEKYSEMNLGRVKAILNEMNGSYKKYDQFNEDIKELKEKIKELEEYGKIGDKLVKKVEALIEKGKMEEARELINEYRSDERYEYMPRKLQDALFDYLNQASGIVW